MKLSTNIILALSCVGHALAWNHATAAELREGLRSQDRALVAFIDPNNSASQALEPEWAAVQQAEGDGLVTSVDCAVEPTICRELDVASFPAIRLYKGSGVYVERYRGPRRASSIRSFLQRTLRPTVSAVSEQNLTSFRSADEVVFVARFARNDAILKSRFDEIAKQYKDRFSFAVMVSAPTTSTTTIVCYNNINGVEKVLSDAAPVHSLQNFVKQCSAPLIPELTRRNEMEYNSKGKSFVHYFVSSPEERDEYVREMTPLARKYDEYLQFTTIDVNEYPEMLPVYGQRPGARKVLSVYHPSNGQIFPYRKMKRASAAAVEQFLLDIIEGKVKPWSGDSTSEKEEGHEEL